MVFGSNKKANQSAPALLKRQTDLVKHQQDVDESIESLSELFGRDYEHVKTFSIRQGTEEPKRFKIGPKERAENIISTIKNVFSIRGNEEFSLLDSSGCHIIVGCATLQDHAEYTLVLKEREPTSYQSLPCTPLVILPTAASKTERTSPIRTVQDREQVQQVQSPIVKNRSSQSPAILTTVARGGAAAAIIFALLSWILSVFASEEECPFLTTLPSSATPLPACWKSPSGDPYVRINTPNGHTDILLQEGITEAGTHSILLQNGVAYQVE